MIKNYIFDFGNVLTEFSPQRLTAPYVDDEHHRQIISEAVFDRLYWDRLDRGTITDDEVKADLCRRLPGTMGELACRVYDDWIINLTPIEGIEQLVRDISRAGKRLYLLSDISRGFAEGYVRSPWIRELFSLFNGLVLSGTVGFVKPQREIFEHLISTHDLVPDECIFIDDRAQNIEGAQSLGIHGYQFDGDVQKLREFLGF